MQTALPTARFAALAIIPGISHRRDSSVDSGSGLSDNLFEDVPSRLDMGFFDSPLSPLPQLRRSPSRTLVPALACSLTLVDTYALRVELPSHYADFSISPLSSTPDFLNWAMGTYQLPLRFRPLPPSWYPTAFTYPFQASSLIISSAIFFTFFRNLAYSLTASLTQFIFTTCSYFLHILLIFMNSPCRFSSQGIEKEVQQYVCGESRWQLWSNLFFYISASCNPHCLPYFEFHLVISFHICND